jgi:hypothetical protein
MRENRPYGSEGGVAQSHPDPYPMHASTGAMRLPPYCALRMVTPPAAGSP